MNTHRNNAGMTLIEVIMTIAIFAIIIISLSLIISLAVSIVRDDQARIDAIALAQTQIETIKNAPYDDIGTVGGVPNGVFTQKQTIVQNKMDFTLKTNIRYVDDPFDGTAPTDTINTDYKQIRVKVTWENQYLDKPVLFITTVAPEGIETDAGGGTLWIEVYNAAVQPIANATVLITNTLLSPAIDISAYTDNNGRYILPGANPSVEAYHVEIAKNGYSAEQTYPVDAINNPNPDPADQTVVEDEVTTKVFYIDLVGALQIHVDDWSASTPIAGLPLRMIGNKRIGTDLDGKDIPKYEQTHTTDTNGDVFLTNLEYDTYTLEIDDALTGVDYAGSDRQLPYILAPDVSDVITIHTAPDAMYSLLVTVEDNGDQPLANATVRIYDAFLSTDVTQTTNAAGQTFFTPLNPTPLNIDVTLTGYNAYTGSITLGGDDQLTIPLTLL